MLKRMKASGKVRLYACTPTMEMFGVKCEDLIPEVDSLVGAATFLDIAADADITLKIQHSLLFFIHIHADAPC